MPRKKKKRKEQVGLTKDEDGKSCAAGDWTQGGGKSELVALLTKKPTTRKGNHSLMRRLKACDKSRFYS